MCIPLLLLFPSPYVWVRNCAVSITRKQHGLDYTAQASRRSTPHFRVAKGRWCGLAFYQALAAADKAMIIMIPMATETLELVWWSHDMADEGSRQSYPQEPHVYVESTHVASSQRGGGGIDGRGLRVSNMAALFSSRATTCLFGQQITLQDASYAQNAAIDILNENQEIDSMAMRFISVIVAVHQVSQLHSHGHISLLVIELLSDG